MKTNLILLLLFFSLHLPGAIGATSQQPQEKPTSIGITLYSNEVETVWNALRFANFSRSKGDTVTVFLLGKGVELDKLAKENQDIKEQTDKLLESGATILGCGTCLRSRNNSHPTVCKFSSLSDLYELVRKNKIVLTF